MEGTLVEYARRSLEERHSIRMLLLTEIEAWGTFDSAHGVLECEPVRDLLRLESDHYMLNYDNPLFEADVDDALMELRQEIESSW